MRQELYYFKSQVIWGFFLHFCLKTRNLSCTNVIYALGHIAVSLRGPLEQHANPILKFLLQWFDQVRPQVYLFAPSKPQSHRQGRLWNIWTYKDIKII